MSDEAGGYSFWHPDSQEGDRIGTQMPSSTRMSQLKIDEISGVDRPAHEVPGWIVAKSAEWRDEVAAFEKDVTGTFDGLTSKNADLYFENAPDDVQKARETLAKHMAEDMEDDGNEIEVRDDNPPSDEVEREGEDEDEDEDATPARKSIKDKIANLFNGAEPAEKAKESSKEDDEDDEDDSEDEKKPKFGSPAWQKKYGKVKKDAEELGLDLPDPPEVTETDETDEDGKPVDADEPEAEAADADEPEADATETSTEKAADDLVDRVTKAVGDVLGDRVSDTVGQILDEELSPLQKSVEESTESAEATRDALGLALDRIENIEKSLAGSTALVGQEDGTPPADEDGDSHPLSKAVGAALLHGTVELN